MSEVKQSMEQHEGCDERRELPKRLNNEAASGLRAGHEHVLKLLQRKQTYPGAIAVQVQLHHAAALIHHGERQEFVFQRSNFRELVR